MLCVGPGHISVYQRAQVLRMLCQKSVQTVVELTTVVFWQGVTICAAKSIATSLGLIAAGSMSRRLF